MFKKYGLVIILSIALLGSGCVYYNTFFLAKKNYRLAERARLKSPEKELPTDAKAKYNIAITKSSKVLSYYPESKYVDDALFLLGMCFYRTGEYIKAIRKFDEIIEAFPESKYVKEALYWRTLCVYELGDYDGALDKLRELAESGEFAEQSMFMMGEVYYEQADYISAKESFLAYINNYPKGRFVSLARLRLANIAFIQERYSECISEAKKIDRSEITLAEYFSSQMLIGEALTALDSLQPALSHYRTLRKNEDFFARWPEVDLKMGDVHYLLGDTTTAIETWRLVCRDFARTENSAWGWFKRASLHLDYAIMAIAKAEFDSSAAQVPSGKVRELALQKSASIAKLQSFKDALSKQSDSVKVDIAATELALAEMYLLELGQPDSALSEYRYIVENYPADSLAPKAAYGVGYVYAYAKKDRALADSAFAALLKIYPESDYAVGAANYFIGRGTALDSLGVRTVAYYFVKAEEYLLTYNRIDSAIANYRIVTEKFPRSAFYPKAVLAQAYIYERLAFNRHLAESLYTLLADSFPGTDYANLARVRLGKAEPVFAREAPPEFKPDTAMVFADTVSKEAEELDRIRRDEGRRARGAIIDPLTGNELPRAPYPRYPVELRYPLAEWNSGLQGRVVRLKIRIDAFGMVKEAEIIATCGNSIIDQAAITGTKETSWNPEDIPIDQIGGWFYFEVIVEKPKTTIDRGIQQ